MRSPDTTERERTVPERDPFESEYLPMAVEMTLLAFAGLVTAVTFSVVCFTIKYTW